MERSEITPSNGTALGSRPSTAELEAARDEVLNNFCYSNFYFTFQNNNF